MKARLTRTARIVLPIATALVLSSPAFASPECTTEPESKWLTEQAMKDKIAALGYVDIKVFKKTKSGCYEIYGHTKDGRKAEVYFNPVDGSVVKENLD
jgi:hypothetical protein